MNKLFSIVLAFACLLLWSCAGQKKEAAFYEELHQAFKVNGSVGLLNGVIDRPASEGPCKVVIVCHGLMDDLNKDNMVAVADTLFNAGYTTVRFDFNGHGESEGELIDMDVNKEVTDLKAVYQYVSEQDWVDKDHIAIAAHSLGGLVAGLVAGDLGKDKVCAAVLHAL